MRLNQAFLAGFLLSITPHAHSGEPIKINDAALDIITSGATFEAQALSRAASQKSARSSSKSSIVASSDSFSINSESDSQNFEGDVVESSAQINQGGSFATIFDAGEGAGKAITVVSDDRKFAITEAQSPFVGFIND